MAAVAKKSMVKRRNNIVEAIFGDMILRRL